MRIKNIIFLLFFLLGANESFSQLNTIKWSGNYIGFMAGIGSSRNYTNKSYANIDLINFIPPYSIDRYKNVKFERFKHSNITFGVMQFAVRPNKSTTNHIQIELGVDKYDNIINLIDNIGTQKNEITTFIQQISYGVNTFRLNPNFIFSTPKNTYNASTVYYGIGPDIEYDMTSSVMETSREVNNNTFSSSIKTREVGHIKKGMNLNLVGKVGFETAIIKRIHLNLEMAYRHGIQYNLGESFHEVGKISLSAGLRFYFAKFGTVKRGPCPAFKSAKDKS